MLGIPGIGNQIATPGLAFLLAMALVQQPNRIAEYKTRFANSSDPIHKAKIMPQLGDAEFQAISKNISDGDLSKALEILQDYRDQVRETLKSLDATHVNAEAHPAGYKQLEISIRQSLRRLDDQLVNLTTDEQEPFLEVRKDIERMDQHLIHELGAIRLVSCAAFSCENVPGAAREKGISFGYGGGQNSRCGFAKRAH